MLLAAIIGLIILLKKSFLVLWFVNIPGIIVYSLVLVWVLAIDIYFTCVYHKYYKKTIEKENKIKKLPVSTDLS